MMHPADEKDLLIKKLDSVKIINKQVVRLVSGKNLDKVMNEVLAEVGECAGGERVYVYERKSGAALNCYEWRAEGATSGLDRLNGITGEDLETLAGDFEGGDYIAFDDVEKLKDDLPLLYRIFAGRDCRSVVLAPIMIGEKFAGFIGCDNASTEMEELVPEMLLTLGSFIGITMGNNMEQEKLLGEYGSLLKSYETMRDASNMRNTLVESVNSGIFAYTLPDREILMINSEAKRLFDYPQDAVGFHFHDMIESKLLPEDSEKISESVKDLKKAGDSIEFIFHIQRDGGDQLAVRCRIRLCCFANGQKYIISAMSDVTEQEKLEKVLSEERRQYRDALEMSSYFSLAVDLTDGYIYNPITASDGTKIIDESRYRLPVLYDEFMAESFERLGMTFLSRDAEKIKSAKELEELYRGGVTHFAGEYYASEKDRYYQIMILLSESGENGHISANIVVDDVTGTRREAAKNQSLIDSLTSLYQSVYYCNMERAEFYVLSLQDKTEEKLPFDGTVKGFVDTYAAEYIAPEFLEEMTRFLTVKANDERFADADICSTEYRRKNTGWCRGTFIVTERRADGGVAAVVFAVSVIEEQKQKEIQAIHDIRQQWTITKSLSEIYFGTWIFDFKEHCITEVTAPEYAKGDVNEPARKNDMRAMVRYFIDHYVMEKNAEAMEAFLNPDTIRERMVGKEFLSSEYQGRINGWCRASFIPMEDDPDRLIFTLQVIDEEKKKELEMESALQQAFEAADSANRAKTTFFSNMSHDMRTPLGAIMGMSAVANIHIEDRERVRDCLDKIDIAGKHLLRLINEVLDMSKIESGQIELQEEPLSIRELVEEISVIMKPQMDDRQHEFRIEVNHLEHDRVLGDSARIQQVILNILGNSAKYTPKKGTIRFSVSEMPSTQDRCAQYELIFEDNGIGMSEEYMAHLFEPFARADDARVHKIQGTGLGMPITKNIVQMMNGTISVESKLDYGTKFAVILPLKLQESTEYTAGKEQQKNVSGSSAAETDDTSFGCNRRLLVAEDYDMNWEVLMALLPDYGFALERAENGQICVEKFGASQPGYYDAILMDMRMPEKNGIEATMEIRRMDREDAHLPIIAMTADAFAEDVQACMDAGMDEHIAKPLDIRRLLTILKRYL